MCPFEGTNAGRSPTATARMQSSKITTWQVSAWTVAVLLVVVGVPGCTGCWQGPGVQRKKELETLEDRKKRKEKLARKENFEIELPIIVPGEPGNAGRPMAKPGHWISVTHAIKANNFNFNAELGTAVTNSRGDIFFVENTPFQLTSSRPAQLPKGQRRVFDTTYFIPPEAAKEGRTAWLSRELRAARGGRQMELPNRQPLITLPGYTYFFLVMANDPDSYAYLKHLTAVNAPTSGELSETRLYYRVLLPKIQQTAPVPRNSLTWTSLAYILWDDVDPAKFTREQRQALLDWLHWGGQLIVSGPNSLEKLKGSFLESFLPATAIETVEIGQEAIDELNGYWSLPDSKTGETRTLNAGAERPLVGVRLDKHANSRDLDQCAGLVTERKIGQGRIVVTSFSLTDRLLLTWSSYDSFFNACLLRRPRREFRKTDFLADSYWADFHPSFSNDPRFITSLRYFSRDIGHYGRVRNTPMTQQQTYTSSPGVAVPDIDPPIRAADRALRDSPWHLHDYLARTQTGMAAWDDSSGVSDAAREALKDAAGISIPKGEFVLRVLFVYLLVLAPLNWAVFRLLGRVEWAWMAAPLIAIIGAISVVRFAQLDIGFARSITEVAVAEVHAEYPRAHVTRFTALYTSLSTGYDFEFEDTGSVSQPFSTQIDYNRSPHDATYTVNMRRRRELRLSGFRVPSNKTGIVHSEQMCDLQGVFRLLGTMDEDYQVQNNTAFALRDAGVLRRAEDGRLEAAWIGDLPSKAARSLDFVHVANDEARFEHWDRSLTTLSYDVQLRGLLRDFDDDDNGSLQRVEVQSDAENFDRFDINNDGNWSLDELRRWCRRTRAGDVSLGQIVELASQGLRLRPGDSRLIGWTDEAMPELKIAPAAAQEVRRTLFLVHLERGRLPAAQPDKNCKADVVDVKGSLLEDDEDTSDLDSSDGGQ